MYGCIEAYRMINAYRGFQGCVEDIRGTYWGIWAYPGTYLYIHKDKEARGSGLRAWSLGFRE